MSMVKTLAKAAIGVAVTKGVTSMIAGGGRRSTRRSSGGVEDLLGAVLGGTAGGGRGAMGGRGSAGGIEDILGAVLGGAAGSTRGGMGSTGGMGDLLSAVLGGKGGAGSGRPYGGPASPAQAGGLGGALGQLLGSQGPGGQGSMGGALEELSRISTGSLRSPGMGESARPFDNPGDGSFGDLINQSLNNFGEPQREPTAAEEKKAEILLRALIQAAKADGKIDASEKSQLTDQLGDLDRQEVDFVNSELRKPIDVGALARDVPRGMEAQVYMMSVMAIDLDTKQEAQYLAELVQALGLDKNTANAINERLGEPAIFR